MTNKCPYIKYGQIKYSQKVMRKIYINFIPLESIKKTNNKACIVVYEKIVKNVTEKLILE